MCLPTSIDVSSRFHETVRWKTRSLLLNFWHTSDLRLALERRTTRTLSICLFARRRVSIVSQRLRVWKGFWFCVDRVRTYDESATLRDIITGNKKRSSDLVLTFRSFAAGALQPHCRLGTGSFTVSTTSTSLALEPHLSLTGGGMLKAGNSLALGLSNSIAIVISPRAHRAPVRALWQSAGHCRLLRRPAPRPCLWRHARNARLFHRGAYFEFLSLFSLHC